MALIGEEDRTYLEQRFAQDMQQDVEIEFFSHRSYHTEAAAAEFDPESEDESLATQEACRITYQIYEELSTLTPHLKVKFHDLDTGQGQQEAQEVGLDGSMLPATMYRSAQLAGQSRFFGIPSGYEFGTLVENIIDLSKGQTHLKETTRQALADIKQPANIIVFVTPT
jgi:hypothetical protein